MTTHEHIKLCADFMGINVTEAQWRNTEKHWVLCDEKGDYSISDIEFYWPDNDWNLLIAACRKFDTLADNFGDNLHSYSFYCDEIDNAVTMYDIKKAFHHLITGIQWYNKNK